MFLQLSKYSIFITLKIDVMKRIVFFILLFVVAVITTGCNYNKTKGCHLTETELIEIKYHYFKWAYFFNKQYEPYVEDDTIIDTILNTYYQQLADSMEYHSEQIVRIRENAGKRYSQDCFFEYTPKWDMECDSPVVLAW